VNELVFEERHKVTKADEIPHTNKQMDAKESSAYQQGKQRLKNVEKYGEELLKKLNSKKESDLKSKNRFLLPAAPRMHSCKFRSFSSQ
jgi:hypothetical protein